ncbi:TonB-dependent receptor [Bacteroides reticulotermitis]|nr:TonB-dependent receptor [Bacteroides reticulotermitis]MBB4044460.1 TonB-dependent receptor [Bacteroides reticulotermitis]
MKKSFRLAAFVLLFMGTGNHASAEEKVNVAKQGTICGRIVDTSKQTLPGATIYIEKLHTGVTSDMNGYYTFANLTPGTYTVKVSYVGYTPVEMSITIPAGKTLEKNVILNEGLELQEIVVGGAFQGQRRAISAQKSSMGITNVVSADQVGKFPDSNIGDALKRINGINVQYDQGEARFGQVRGTSADLSSVTINGNRLPSAEGDTRNVQLDLIPADMVQTIEVNKVVTADMDGDAIGGSINLITKSTPYKRLLSATAGSGYNWISRKAQLNLGFTYGDRFFNDKLGMMAAVSYQNSPSGSDNVEFEYDTDKQGNVVLVEAQKRQYYVTRERQSYSLALDYDINPNHRITLKGIYNRRHDWENRYRVTYKDLDKTGLDKDGDMQQAAQIETKGGTPDNRNARLELQQTMDFSLGGEHQFGRLSMDWGASYARATEDRPNERYFSLKQDFLGFNVVDAGNRFPYIATDVSLHNGEADDRGKWKVKELSESNQNIYENDWKFKVDFELPLTNGFYGNKLKFGAKYASKTKDKEVTAYDYTKSYSKVSGTAYMDNLASQIRDGFMPGEPYKATDFVSKEYLGSLDLSTLEGKQVLEESSGNYHATENIASTFFRFDQNLGKKMKLMVGLRMEATHIKYNGWNWNVDEAENETLDNTGDSKHNYVNWLPSVLFKYDVNDDFKVRASFTETLSRPKYSALIPCVNVNRKDNELVMGNADLTPTISYNFDLSADYYFKSIGLVSAGVFYKKINDFIVDQVLGNYMYQNYEYKKFTQPKNAGDADLLGVELAYQRDFGFIAPALKCLGFYGTYTYTHTRVNDFNFEGRENEKDLSLPGSPKHTANASLYFEKKGFSARLSYNFASSFIDEMGKVADLDRYYDAVNYMDLNASYTFGKKIKTTFYADATNLLNQPLRYYQGTKDRTMQAEYYGVKVNAGVKVNF